MRDQLFDKLVGLLVVTFFSAVFGAYGQVHLPNWGFYNNARFKLCSSEVCNKTRNIIMKNINSSIDVCDDFYEHVCSGWKKKNPANAQTELVNQLYVLKIKTMRQLKELISTHKISDVEAVRKAKNFYDSCVNLDDTADRGIGPIKDLVSANGGWPLAMHSETWNLEDANLSFEKILQNYVKMGVKCPFFSITVVPNCFNDSAYILSLNYERNLKERWRYPGYQRIKREVFDSVYYTYIESVATEMAKSIGNAETSKIRQDVQDLLTFENDMSEASNKWLLSNTERLTIRELQESWDKACLLNPEYSINWLAMIGSYFDGTDIAIDPFQKIIVPSPFVKLMVNLLKKTPLRTTVNYIHWFEIDFLLPFANKKMRDVADKFIRRTKIYRVVKDRANFCINENQMDHALSYMYAEKYFSKEDQITVNDMVSEIQTEMKRHFNESSWMDNNAKLLAMKKVDGMRKNIGYPDWYNQKGKIDEYYDKLKIGPNFFENVLNVRKFKQIQEFMVFLKPRNETTHLINSFVVHGTYKAEENLLDFPAARFQMAFSHPELPVFMLYGGIGAAIAQEIINGFYREGRRSRGTDDPGELIWQHSTFLNYIQKTSCLAQQYSSNSQYALMDTSHFVHVIDLTGFTIGVRAYLSYKNKKKPKNFKIPAVNGHTDEQLFFYGLVNTFCESREPDTYNNVSAESVRISGALSNMAEFNKAFNCPRGSRMNPIKKCTL